ncbi:MAG: UDP-glucose/GDP-mannose dehydrogenase family protein [Nanoarchaeota archaeon]|nr:UDP-glucose/GDP-mannose dehydrogenase family protein [Nanoarchaeota archaeon]
MQISVFGTGYVGLVTGSCLAKLGHEVMCMDINEKKIQTLKQGIIPFFEPGLRRLVLKNVEKRKLFFTSNAEDTVKFGKVIFNCVGTPSQPDGSADLVYIYQVAESIGKYINEYKVIVNKSTVPPGTAKETERIIKENLKYNVEFDVVSNPEFLKEGAAISDFEHPDKIVLGTHSEKAFRLMKQVYLGRLRNYLPMLETDWETAELIKYANNCFLATKISFINEIANICDKVGADVRMVAKAMGLDYRISPKFLNPGIGFGGSCFPKDVRALIATAKKNNYQPKLLEEVDTLNMRQKTILMPKIKQIFPNLKDKTFCLWGLSFKPKTDDIREASSLHIINELLNHGAKINAHDPEAMENTKKLFQDKINFFNTPEEAAQGADSIILVTEWDEFRNLNLADIKKTMKDNKLFDGRNIYEPELVKEDGFEYYGVGRK